MVETPLTSEEESTLKDLKRRAKAQGRAAWKTAISPSGIILLVMSAIFFGGAGYFAGITWGWGIEKGKHAVAVALLGGVGFWCGFLFMWTINHAPWIRERATPAADDSRAGIEEWRAIRKANPTATWSNVDAQSLMATCVRYGASVLAYVWIITTFISLAK